MVDAAVVEAMWRAIGETAADSSKTIGFIAWRAKEILAGQEDAADVEIPSRATLIRLYSKLATGTYATGSARTRRSVNARPPGPFGEVPASAPGRLMQIDSIPLDVLVRLDDSIAEKVELTAMVDIATRLITGGAAADDEISRRLRVAGPQCQPGGDATGLVGSPADVPFGAAAPAAAELGRASGARGGTAVGLPVLDGHPGLVSTRSSRTRPQQLKFLGDCPWPLKLTGGW
ncbi:hypothetical protein [Streptomyces sp. WAC 05379]|uniref:hypothetical protein n=1 Tax=Streptomyces sp. WAC 05379 TaxID=2203207 RepID=UPI00289EC8B7|nr:hypothetical protein [Streptomyces sp. WAC 05379]